MLAYLVLTGKVRLSPQITNLCSSSMDAMGRGIKSMRDVLELPVQMTDEAAKIPSTFMHEELFMELEHSYPKIVC